jgi:hypothetical protein
MTTFQAFRTRILVTWCIKWRGVRKVAVPAAHRPEPAAPATLAALAGMRAPPTVPLAPTRGHQSHKNHQSLLLAL